MSNVKDAYNNWSSQYDTNENKTRDLEAIALREILNTVSFERCLEIGCGTGKNTTWFLEQKANITAVDLSEEMLAKAKKKISSDKVNFIQADITKEWNFTKGKYDLISYSLVLEHIEDLDFIFKNTAQVLGKDGYVYIGELHPFKQYSGSKARFDTDEGRQIVTCFTHHISEFIQTAKKHGLALVDLNEYFDNNNKKDEIPRILTLLLKKSI